MRPRIHIHASKDSVTVTIGDAFTLVIDSEPTDVAVVEQVAKLDEIAPPPSAPVDRVAIKHERPTVPDAAPVDPTDEGSWRWSSHAPAGCEDQQGCRAVRGCMHDCGYFVEPPEEPDDTDPPPDVESTTDPAKF